MPLATASSASTQGCDSLQLSRCCCSCACVLQGRHPDELVVRRVCRASEKAGGMGGAVVDDDGRGATVEESVEGVVVVEGAAGGNTGW